VLTDQQTRLYKALTMICEGATLKAAAEAAGVDPGELAAEIARPL